MSFISWFLFVIFGGIGLAALPLDLIYDFATRPKLLKQSEIDKQKNSILLDSNALKELAIEVRVLEDKGAKTKNSKFIIVIY
jgi:LMBR1 domain-containing protein 1